MGKEVYVERNLNTGKYKATTKSGQVVASGNTQEQTIKRAKKEVPDAAVLAERQRNTKSGSRDKWRSV